MNKSSRGFTLIELLVVIAIIGILSGVVYVSMGGIRANGRDARRQSDIRNITTAMEVYNNANNGYLVAASPTAPLAIGASMPAVPGDPTATTGSCSGKYCWVTSTASDYCVFAKLEKPPVTSGNVVIFAGGPTGVTQKEVAPADTTPADGIPDAVTLTACE